MEVWSHQHYPLMALCLIYNLQCVNFALSSLLSSAPLQVDNNAIEKTLTSKKECLMNIPSGSILLRHPCCEKRKWNRSTEGPASKAAENATSISPFAVGLDEQWGGGHGFTAVLKCLETLGRRAADGLAMDSMITDNDTEPKLKRVKTPLYRKQFSLGHTWEYFLSSNQVLLSHQTIEQIASEENPGSPSMAFYVMETSITPSSAKTVHSQENSVFHLRSPMKKEPLLVSDILTVSLSDTSPVLLKDNVSLIFRHKAAWSRRGERLQCVFWDMSAHRWSDQGCQLVQSNLTHTHCQCQHLSSFAVIFNIAMTTQDVRSTGQTALTYTLLPISIMGLSLSLFTFMYFKNLKSIRNTVHVHMLSSLLAGQLLFLFGIRLTEIGGLCQFIAISMHFAFLSTFFWMLMEGVHVYLMLVQPTTRGRQSKSSSAVYYGMCVFAYGVPILIVGITVACNYGKYSADLYCWLNTEHGIVWSFVGPALFVILINSFMLGLAVYVMCKHSRSSRAMQSRSFRDRLKVWTRGVIMLLVLLGIPYVFGLLHLNRYTEFFSYVFIYLNGTQGGFIFVFHCLASDKVLAEYRRWLYGIVTRLVDILPAWMDIRPLLPESIVGGGTCTVQPRISVDSHDPLEGLLAGWERPRFGQYFPATPENGKTWIKKRKDHSFLGVFMRKFFHRYSSEPDTDAERGTSDWVGLSYVSNIMSNTVTSALSSAFLNDSPTSSISTVTCSSRNGDAPSLNSQGGAGAEQPGSPGEDRAQGGSNVVEEDLRPDASTRGTKKRHLLSFIPGFGRSVKHQRTKSKSRMTNVNVKLKNTAVMKQLEEKLLTLSEASNPEDSDRQSHVTEGECRTTEEDVKSAIETGSLQSDKSQGGSSVAEEDSKSNAPLRDSKERRLSPLKRGRPQPDTGESSKQPSPKSRMGHKFYYMALAIKFTNQLRKQRTSTLSEKTDAGEAEKQSSSEKETERKSTEEEKEDIIGWFGVFGGQSPSILSGISEAQTLADPEESKETTKTADDSRSPP